MTTNKSAKKLVRDIQDRTGWTYTFARRAVEKFGYEEISKKVDDALEAGEVTGAVRTTALEPLGRELSNELRDVQ